MRKIVGINAVPYGSTAQIMTGIANLAKNVGIDYKTVTGYSSHPASFMPKDNFIVSGKVSKMFHILLSRFSGLDGMWSIIGTKKLLRILKKESIDCVHLHNLHGWYINIPMLFKYIKKHNLQVIWTLHDCWAFTGHCPHFDMIGCNKWKTGCFNCPQYNLYPQSLVDNSKFMYKNKKSWFTNVKNLTIVTPSNWLAGLVKQSFLNKYNLKVLNNGINLSVFKPTESNFRKDNNCEDCFVILGVSFGWTDKKGIDVFIKLSKRLSSKYKIVLVGTDDKVDSILPENIISIHQTQNQEELVQIYSSADLFVNPTREENFPTVNIEALACGTPVLTFKTGGSTEIADETCGSVVEKDDIDAMEKEIIRICTKKPFLPEDCIQRASNFNMYDKFNEYISLYMDR